ncbi:hypothetical protein F8B43_4175 [Methylorubrum populi]|uniref:Uncharacterized protein n=1 Tax=Methylorubrum populi TaxID=223967 RepID=A0A833J3V1_9HYPH|nr:hypothetical protein F8B43_4175 [Methylorubrum populi]
MILSVEAAYEAAFDLGAATSPLAEAGIMAVYSYLGATADRGKSGWKAGGLAVIRASKSPSLRALRRRARRQMVGSNRA